ncbi:hypothetical protein DM01DRAFT_1338441 [Hesseltinella vesiculosa]|uniref:HMG box domain-containing protein n=1 Tax=Hesseltinella vesiculosa TaxID=101127 RepID=A0A1X2GA09_9FUNG|nr:hypothetical protein DM01DRAFT_1338441 [Hesseltinella vesiculosa]
MFSLIFVDCTPDSTKVVASNAADKEAGPLAPSTPVRGGKNRGRVEKKIARPMNNYFTYMNYMQIWVMQYLAMNGIKRIPLKHINKHLGEQWKREPSHIKLFFSRLADINNLDHMRANPGYKYRPAQTMEKKRGKKDIAKARSLKVVHSLPRSRKREVAPAQVSSEYQKPSASINPGPIQSTVPTACLSQDDLSNMFSVDFDRIVVNNILPDDLLDLYNGCQLDLSS